MAIYLLAPNDISREQGVKNPTDEWIYNVLHCESWEIASERIEYNGDSAQMIVDEDFMLTDKPFNEKASELLERARGGEAPIFGAALILTGDDRFE